MKLALPKSIKMITAITITLASLLIVPLTGMAKEVYHVASKEGIYVPFSIEHQIEVVEIEQMLVAMKNQKEKEEKEQLEKERKQKEEQEKLEKAKKEKEKQITLAKSSTIIPNESFYVKNIPMPYEHQKYLYEMTEKRGLDYKEMLAFIGHESTYNPNAKGGDNYGYFQINRVNHQSLAKKLGTANNAFDPYVNINWGTYMIADLYKKYGNKEAVLSAYSRGEGGYAKKGNNLPYIKKHNQVLASLK